MDDKNVDEWTTISKENPSEVIKSLETVSEKLEADDWSERNTAAMALTYAAEEYPTEVADDLSSLVGSLNDDKAAVRYNVATCINTIAKANPDQLVDHLDTIVTATGDEEESVRQPCLEVLQNVNDNNPEALERVIDDHLADFFERVADGNHTKTDHRMLTLLAIGFPEIMGEHRQSFVDLFADEDPVVQHLSTAIIDRISSETPEVVTTIVPSLVNQLSEEDTDITKRAASALANIADADTEAVAPEIESIADHLYEEPTEIQAHIATVIRELATVYPDRIVILVDQLATLATSSTTSKTPAREALKRLAEAHPTEVQSALEACGIEDIESVESALNGLDNEEDTQSASVQEIAESVLGEEAAAELLENAGLSESDSRILDPSERPSDECAYGQEVEEAVWTCSHDPQENGDYCIFHTPVEDKETEAVQEAFLNSIQEKGKEAKEFIGARFESLDLSYEAIQPPDNYPINLTNVTIQHHLECEHTIFDSPLWLVDAEIGKCRLDNAIVRHDLIVNDATFGAFAAERAEFGKNLTADNLTVNGGLSLQSSQVAGFVDFPEATITGDVDFWSGTFQRAMRCQSMWVGGEIDAQRITCGSSLSLRDSTIKEDLQVRSAAFTDGLVLHNAEIGGELGLSGISADDTVAMTRCTVEQTVDLSQAELEDTLMVASANLGALEGTSPSFRGDVYANGLTVDDHTKLEGVSGQKDFACQEATLGESAELSGTFEQIQFRNTTLSKPGSIDFSGSTINNGEIKLPADPKVIYDVTDATLGNVELAATDDTTPLFEHFRFENTTFDGFDFAPYKDALDAVDWRIHTLTDAVELSSPEVSIEETLPDSQEIADLDDDAERYAKEMFNMLEDMFPLDLNSDIEAMETEAEYKQFLDDMIEQVEALDDPTKGGPTTGELETTYLKAKNGAAQTNADEIAASFFIQEMKFRRQRHADEFWSANSIRNRVAHAWDWTTNLILDVVAGYGEKPRNVVGMSLVLVIAFSAVFQLIDALEGTTNPVDYVLFSLQNYVAFLVGSDPRGSLIVQYVSAIEAFLGAFLIALFVFTLTRSLNR